MISIAHNIVDLWPVAISIFIRNLYDIKNSIDYVNYSTLTLVTI